MKIAFILITGCHSKSNQSASLIPECEKGLMLAGIYELGVYIENI